LHKQEFKYKATLNLVKKVTTGKRKQRKKKAKLLHDFLNVAKSLNICLNHGQSNSQQMVPDNLHPVTNSISKHIKSSILYKI